jgi:hypothetical protein
LAAAVVVCLLACCLLLRERVRLLGIDELRLHVVDEKAQPALAGKGEFDLEAIARKQKWPLWIIGFWVEVVDVRAHAQDFEVG